MKKTAVFLFTVILIITAVMLSCAKSNPASPAATATPQATATNTPYLTATPTFTATLTSTSTPNYGTLSGNVQLPAGQAQPGYVFQVLVDTDMYFANGYTYMTIGTCGASENVPYSVTLTPGTYYVYAIVKTAGCLNCTPVQGDYLGWLGAVYPLNPAAANTVIAANTVLSGQNITMALAVNNVVGTIYTSVNSDGKNILIAADTDSDPSSGVFYMDVKPVAGTTGTGPFAYSYGLLCYFPGSFYFTAQIATNGHTLPGAPQTGDFVGNTGPHTIDPATVPNGPFDINTIQMP